MDQLKRGLVGAFGLVSLATALALWFGMDRLLSNMGLAPTDLGAGLVGRATVRADIAGLFGGMGIAMLFAAVRRSRAWTDVVLLFVICAISGRLVSVLLDGGPAIVWPPILVEAVVIGVLVWFRAGLPRAR